ncbi:uncharacterized protein LOC124888868 [Capsicum annuum]|uniref:uncharacterized protein LOC124888868 n=1 Tax=Capsicum annuum TaxID=4072 RepID=UPI001FB154E6|nr:uncharacterized protein LOC124888868 [Capsicum annuum]
MAKEAKVGTAASNFGKMSMEDMMAKLLKGVEKTNTRVAEKKADPGSFTIPCMVKSLDFSKALCDLEASINLMSLAIYKQSGLGDPTTTNMPLVIEDRSVKWHMGILYDVLVKEVTYIFPVDFDILDCEMDFEVPIILGRPFLAIRSILIDLRANELLFWMNDEVDIEEYEETVCALIGMGSYSYSQKKLNLDLKNRPSPAAKPFIEEPPVLELTELPSHLRLVREEEIKDKLDIDDSFLDEKILDAKLKQILWYDDFANYTVSEVMLNNLSFHQRIKFLHDVTHYFSDEPYLFRRCADGIIRHCVPEVEVLCILETCHASPVGGHYAGDHTAQKVL